MKYENTKVSAKERGGVRMSMLVRMRTSTPWGPGRDIYYVLTLKLTSNSLSSQINLGKGKIAFLHAGCVVKRHEDRAVHLTATGPPS